MAWRVEVTDRVQDDRIGLNIQATAPTDEDKVADYSSFEVKIKSERTGATTTAKLNKAGTAVVTVDKGSYSIEITLYLLKTEALISCSKSVRIILIQAVSAFVNSRSEENVT